MKNFLNISLLVCITTLPFSCSGDKNIYKINLSNSEKIDTLSVTNINFYLESSVSMKGYVDVNKSGNYPLKDIIPFLITDLDNTFNLNLNLFTYSDKAQKYPLSKQDFFNQLRSGKLLDGKSSKLQNIFSNIISNTQDGSINILITDCILDLGEDKSLSEGGLVTEQIYRELLSKEDLGVAVFQYLSDFNGTYYFDRNNTGGKNVKLRPFVNTTLQNRPFYVWIFGHTSLVNDVLSKNIIKDYKAAHFYNLKLDALGIGLLEEPKSGKISINTTKNEIFIKEVSQKRPAKFTIGLNVGQESNIFKNIILDSANYKIKPDFIKSINIKTFDKSLLLGDIKDKGALEKAGYSYFIQPILNDFDTNTEELTIRLINKKPDWITNTNLSDDLNISAENLEFKTFSFQYIMDAFERRFSKEEDLLVIEMTKI